MCEEENLEYQIELSEKAVLKGTLKYVKGYHKRCKHAFDTPMPIEITIEDDTSVKVLALDSNESGTGEHLEGAVEDLFDGMVFLKNQEKDVKESSRPIVECDNVTELTWLTGPDKDMTWDMANAWVESLNSDKFAGGGWRMPTRKELGSIYEKGKGKYNITLPLKISGLWVWSGEVESSSAWLFGFNDGIDRWTYRDSCRAVRGFAVRQR